MSERDYAITVHAVLTVRTADVKEAMAFTDGLATIMQDAMPGAIVACTMDPADPPPFPAKGLGPITPAATNEGEA